MDGHSRRRNHKKTDLRQPADSMCTMPSAAHVPPIPSTSPVHGWLFAAMVGVVLGCAMQLQQPRLFQAHTYLAMALAGPLLLGVSLLWRRSRGLPSVNGWGLWVVGCAIAVSAFGLCGWRATVFMDGTLSPELEGRDVLVTGVISAMPQRSEAGLRFRLAVETASLEGVVVDLPSAIDLGWYGSALEDAPEDGASPAPAFAARSAEPPVTLRVGERWRMLVRLKAPHGLRNPNGFDYELWLWEQGVQATGYVRSGPRDPVPKRLALTWRHPVEQARQHVRDAVFKQLDAAAGTPNAKVAGLVAALVVGDQRAIDRVDWDVFRATGVAHLMSISGLHITMFAWLAAMLLGWGWRRSAWLCVQVPAPSAALLGGLALATAYALFSGWGVPSQRTVLMLAIVTLLRLSGRRWPWPFVWLLACAVVVTVDPWALLQAGFWLSFVAVGVLFATDAGAGVARDSAKTSGLQVRSRLHAMVREQWVVTVALAPLALLFFGQMSVVGLLANLLAIPWITLVVTPLAMLGVVLPPLWHGAAWALAGFMVVLQWMAQWSFATFSIASPALWVGVFGILGGILLVAHVPWWTRLLGLPLVLPVLLWQAPRPVAGEFEVLAADIGQGSAVLVRTAGHTLVYDAGPRYSVESDAGHRVLVPLLRALDERVDMLLLSHRDLDHTGGAAAVLAMQPQAALVSSLEHGHPLLALRASTRCTAGQRWEWDGVAFEVLHPQASDYGLQKKTNAMSCVLRVSTPHQSVLLAGDIEAAQEASLVATRAQALRVDVLLVPHHGSKTSSSAAFLDVVQPRFALVQAGYRNRFGHPAPGVMTRYTDRGIAVRESVRCGAATWASAVPGEVQCERERSPRYWQHVPP